MNTIVEVAGGGDWPYVESLRRKEGGALGFVPKDCYLSVLERRPSCNRNRFLYERVWLASDNGDPTGFCYAAFPRTGVAKIHQICVQEDARRWHRALMLEAAVEAEARTRGMHSVEARVAVDLEANLYWRAMGYEVDRTERSTFLQRAASKSGRLLAVYRKTLSDPLQPALLVAS